MIKVYCNGTRIQCLRQGELTVGMAGAPIEFDFSEEWNGLGKTAVFRCDGERDVIVGADGVAVVPHEILTTPGMDVEVGVYAAKEDGTTWPAPTPFCRIGRVKEGADPSGDESYPPTPDVGEQAIAAASTALQAAAAAQEAAAEIQRRADAGEFDGAPGYTPIKGKDYFDGAPGYTPVKGKDYFDGKDGNDYVLTEADKVEIAEIAAGLVDVPEGGGSADLTGYATEEWVEKGYQPKGNYLTEVPAGYAKTEDIPTTPADIGAQPAGNYALKSEIPAVPVKSVNGKTGAVSLSASDVGADASGTAASAVSGHNTNAAAHSDIRLMIDGLTSRINALANSTDEDLDQMAELVAYIKNNKSLIDGITTSKVNVADIVNNLTTNVSNKPLSAAQGVALKSLVDGLQSGKLDASELTAAINTALAQAKESGEFDGATGQRGTGLLAVTTGPSSYTTAVGDITPKYRMALSTIKTQAGVTEVLLGDTIRHSYYHYPIDYLDASYAYFENRVSIRGAAGTTPVKGTDYFTDADKDEMVEAVATEIQSTIPEPVDGDMPKVFLTGTEFSNMTNDKNEVNMEMEYRSKTKQFHAYIAIKRQGTSSLGYDKKNFTVKLFDDEAHATKQKHMFRDWKHEKHKFVLKANYIDHSHARNIVCANLWDEVVSSRSDYDTLPAELRNSPKNGAVDGFPVKLYVNGTYQGVYTWNIGKDDWMWGMDEDNANHILLCAEYNTNGVYEENACNFRKVWNGMDGSRYSIEVGTNSDALKTSLNNLITFVMNNNGNAFKAGIGTYLDVQSAIDYYIHQYVICGMDGLAKNMLLGTYDGTKWYCGAYDMDSTFGLYWNGSKFVSAEYKCPEDYQEKFNLLWERLEENYWTELKARYAELRKTVYSVGNMFTHFERFMDTIGLDLYAEDLEIYTGIPNGSTNNIKQLRNYICDRLNYCDQQITTGVPATAITLSKTSVSLSPNATVTLTSTVVPSNTTDEILWLTSNPAIATVSGGTIKAVATGSCEIRAKCGSGYAVCAVTVAANKTYYSVTNTLTNSTNSNSTASVEEGSAYNATITANSGYKLDTVKVTMGGADVTSSVYSNGAINISAVTGNIVITVNAVKNIAYTNLVPTAIDTNGSIFNGTGYKYGQRVSSSGVIKVASYEETVCVGYLPAKSGDIFQLKNMLLWDTSIASNLGADCAIALYDSSFKNLGVACFQDTANYTNYSKYGVFSTSNLATPIKSVENGITTFEIPNVSNVAYVVISGRVNLGETGDLVIVTKNEEIT